MDEAPWSQVKRVLAEALEREPAQREAFIDEACGEDDALRARVLQLLAQEARADQAFEASTISVAIHEDPTDLSAVTGRTIGRYAVQRIVASGGMGTIYEAVQDHPHRLVALKVLQRGAASRQAMKRFHHEAEILGLLKHVYIAQIYDAGTFDDGQGAQPYFAMELVKGRPLIEYSDAKNLGPRDRLGLFVKICDAVQYAHHKGVIHRDLKPDNILVDDLGEPKILDFGVARATGSDIQVTTLRTDIGQLIGTVPYMSPEQVTGDPEALDTRSDVYSLGVVLYELMCGQLPLDLKGKTIPEAVRVIREDDPRPLGSADRIYRGDVETIVAKALEKEKDRRYQTAAELAADVRHNLADEPIVARPPSTFYQLRKFTRRNRALVGGVIGMLALFVSGTIVSTVGFLQANTQRVAAQEETAKAIATNKFLLRMFALANPAEESAPLGHPGSGRVLSLEELVDRAAGELETAFPDWPDVRADMHFRLAKTYWGLGRRDDMWSHGRRAHQLRAEILGEDHPDTLETSMWLAGWLVDQRSDAGPEAVPELRRVVTSLEQQLGSRDRRTIFAKMVLAVTLAQMDSVEDAGQLLKETIDAARVALGDNSRDYLTAVRFYAVGFDMMGSHAEMEPLVAEALEAARHSLPEGDLLTVALSHRLGRALRAQGRVDEALELFDEAFRWTQRGGIGTYYNALNVTQDLTFALRDVGKASEAEGILRQQLDDCRREHGDHEYTVWALWQLGNNLKAQNRIDEAEALLRENHAHFVGVVGEDSYYMLFLTELYAGILRDLDRLEEAEPLFRQVLEGRRRVNPESRFARRTMHDLASVLERQGKLDEALSFWRERLDILRRVRGDDHERTLQTMQRLAGCLQERGPENFAEVETLLLDVYRGHASSRRRAHRPLRCLGQAAEGGGVPRAAAGGAGG
ncbi:MAG: protein kinase domain-containing protein [Planctomycetota bacterium]|jgi:non-specific serine/threonine protein kinase/serine/threonine-protein kinase